MNQLVLVNYKLVQTSTKWYGIQLINLDIIATTLQAIINLVCECPWTGWDTGNIKYMPCTMLGGGGFINVMLNANLALYPLVCKDDVPVCKDDPQCVRMTPPPV